VGEPPWRGTVVDVELHDVDDRTRVVVTQRRFAAALREHVPYVDAGWACVLALLKEYLEHHAGRPRREVKARRDARPDPAAVAQALAGADAIQRWAGESPARVLATTPHGAVVTFPGIEGVFTLMAMSGVAVWHSTWSEHQTSGAGAKANELCDRFAARVQPR
jgi:hypothetical protein